MCVCVCGEGEVCSGQMSNEPRQVTDWWTDTLDLLYNP